MAETYCGKMCADCAQKETLNCPGCKFGPGRQHDGDCSLAKCCRDKGHQECTTCGFNRSCGILQSKDHMPEYRLKSLESEKILAAATAKRAPFFGKWLWILFWLIIPNMVASVMTEEKIVGLVPALWVPGQALIAICTFVYGFILLRLSSEEEEYRTAGICRLVVGVASVVLACVSDGSENLIWTLLISIPAAIVSFVGAYNEFKAHAIVLTGVDYELSGKWATLKKWYMIIGYILLGSLLVFLVVPALSLLVGVAIGIGICVISILKLIYLYRTAKLFRKYPVEVA